MSSPCIQPLRRPALLLAVALLACGPGGWSARDFEARCVGVRDGDTLEVRHRGETLRVRLHGIDCPERGQPYHQVARRRTTELALGKLVRVEIRDRDQYDRLVARVFVDGEDLSLRLVGEGLAWHYTFYSSDARLATAELRARGARTGLWQEPDPVPPWEHRRRQRRRAG